MSADDEVVVNVTGNTADVNAKLTQAATTAEASFTKMKISMNEVNEIAARTGLTEQQVMTQINAMAAAQAAAAGITSSTLVPALAEAEATTLKLGLTANQTTMAMRAMIDESLSNRWRQFDGTMARVVISFLTANPEFVAAAGAITALGGALAFAAVEALRFASAARDVQASAAFFNFDASGKEIDSFVEQLHKMSGVSYDDTRKIMQNFIEMKNSNDGLTHALIDNLDTLARAMGETPVQASKKLADAFSEPLTKGEEFLQHMHASAAAVKAFDDAVIAGDSRAALTVMLNELTAASQRLETVQPTATAQEKEAVQSMMGLSGAYEGATQSVDLYNKAIQEIDASRTAKMASDVGKAIAETPIQAESLETVREKIAQIGVGFDGLRSDLLAKQEQMWKDYSNAAGVGAKEAQSAVTEAANTEKERLKAVGEEEIADDRQKISALAAQGTLSRTQLLSQEAVIWQESLNGSKLNANQRVAVERDYNILVTQLHSARAEELMHSDEQITAEAKRGSLERVADARKEVTDATAIYKEGSDQEISAVRQFAAAAREASDANTATNARSVQNQIRESQEYLTAQEKIEEQKVKLGEQSNTEYLANIKALIQSETALQSVYYDVLASFYSKDDARYQEAMLAKERITQQSNQRIAEYTNQAAEQAARDWEKAMRPMQSAFDTFARDVIEGNKTMGQAAKAMLATWITDELQATARVLMNKLAAYASDTLGFTEGAAARTAAQQAENTAGIGGLLTQALEKLGIYAAETFGGVFAFLAPAMGPAAAGPAGAADAEVMAALPFIGFAQGAWDLPSDVHGATLHQGESIMPQDWASGFRSAVSGAGGGSGGANVNVAYTINAVDGQSVQRMLRQNGGAVANELVYRLRQANGMSTPTGALAL